MFSLAQHVPLAPRVTAAMGLAWSLFGTVVGQDVYADPNRLEIFSLLRTECVKADPSVAVELSSTSSLYLRNDLFHLSCRLAKTISPLLVSQLVCGRLAGCAPSFPVSLRSLQSRAVSAILA